MRKAAPFVRCVAALLLAAAAGRPASAQMTTLTNSTGLTTPTSSLYKIDPLAQRRILDVAGRSWVIVRVVDGASPRLSGHCDGESL